jgi:thiamine biosynthesis lipoprotein
MGSPLRVTVPGLDDRAADAAWAIVQRTFSTAEDALTRFHSTSPLSRLNRRAGAWTPVPARLSTALVAAWRAYRTTAGRFDPRIIGALEAAGERAGVDLPASPTRLGADERWLAIDARRGRARVAAPVDLGGIGKGLALRWSATALRRAGFARFLVAAGGDVVAAGTGPSDRAWVIGVADPRDPARIMATVELVDAAVATSSIAVRSWHHATRGLRHHLIDPATLEPAEPVWTAVTVVDGDPAWAEIHSKVAFLAGRGIGAVLDGRRAWWIDASGALRATG